ncbi:MAG: phytase [Fimbriimonadales bacterium]|nr:phytase [Fimbriimonadales bacterium]
MISTLLCAIALLQAPVHDVAPSLRLEAVADDADDVAIWIHPKRPAQSLLIGNDKTAAPTGGLYVYGLDGKVRQKILGIDRPNNVDVEYGLRLQGRPVDIAVATERLQRRLRIFAIDPRTQTLRDVSGKTDVFVGEPGERVAPMGIGLYRRPSDGSIFAFVSPKEGPTEGYLGVYRLVPNGPRVDCVPIGRAGRFSGEGEIEAIVVDDFWGVVHYADEGYALRKIVADPASPRFGQQLGEFGHRFYQGDREGLAIYDLGEGRGFLLSSNQLKGGSEVLVYDRRSPHALLARLRLGADDTDGLDCTSHPLPGYPKGLLAVMNSEGRNYLVAGFEPILGLLSARARLP